MISFTLRLSKRQKEQLSSSMKRAETAGDLAKVKRLLAILLFNMNNTVQEIIDILQISDQSVRSWIKAYLVHGLRGLRSGKSPGRPSKLTKKQRKELCKCLNAGPESHGFPGNCWRSPMIQHLIAERFGIFYNVHYISELLHSLGFSYQKAAFVASKQDKQARQEWLEVVWPEIITLGEKKNAYILFGDESSFPQWGSLSYTWAPIGKQPIVQTSGSRRGYKVFGLIDYFSGRFFSKGHEGKLNADSYIEFLGDVLAKTRKHIILVQDGAPYHRSKKVIEFFQSHRERLTVYRLPSYSPDFNPIEKSWKKIKEKGIHLKYFPTFDDLKNKVNEMLDIFEDAKNEVLTLFGFYDKLNAA